jgi:RNA-directed DNA polymerase
MTAGVLLTGAPTHNQTVDWVSLNWSKLESNVRRLQARIVQAVQAGRWGKAKALRRLLTRSFSAKALAVKRVTENKGRRTTGVDGETWTTPRQKAAAIGSLRSRGYQSQPRKRVYIPKPGSHKQRKLGIPTMKDRAMEALQLQALGPIAETTGDPNCYGFRPKRSTADAIEQCFIILGRKQTAQWVMEGDIRACFDEISHQWLAANIPLEPCILEQWLKAGVIDGGTLHEVNAGTPQGGIASPVMANLTLDGLEQKLQQQLGVRRSLREKNKVHLVRYADDFIISGSNRSLLEEEVIPTVRGFLRERGLTLSPDKTHVTHIDQGFDFLGQNLRKYNGKLLIKPARKSVKVLLQKVRRVVKANAQATAGHLILQLNPILRGWANYHRHVVSKAIFGNVAHQISDIIWRWAARRHPRKSRRWTKQKYFRTVGSRNRVFFGQIEGRDNQPYLIDLFDVAGVSIKRHIKIRNTANPYDPQWREYFDKRQARSLA